MNKLRVVGAAIIDGRRVLAALRSPQMSTPNVWEFPGGKVEDGETEHDALHRELREELGIAVRINSIVGTVATHKIQLSVYSVTLIEGEPVATEHARIRWVPASELPDLHWAEADKPLIPALIDLLDGVE